VTTDTARAFARRLQTETSPSSIAGIRAAMEVGGFDPDTTPPATPETYCERAVCDALAWNPAVLTYNELSAMIDASEAVNGGVPF
jgi:hypothetical protein